MAEDTPEKRPERKRQQTNWTAFDIKLIMAARDGHVVDFFFVTDLNLYLDDEEQTYFSLSGTVLTVDRYWVEASVLLKGRDKPTSMWFAKAVLAAVVVNSPPKEKRVQKVEGKDEEK